MKHKLANTKQTKQLVAIPLTPSMRVPYEFIFKGRTFFATTAVIEMEEEEFNNLYKWLAAHEAD